MNCHKGKFHFILFYFIYFSLCGCTDSLLLKLIALTRESSDLLVKDKGQPELLTLTIFSIYASLIFYFFDEPYLQVLSYEL